MRFGSSSVSMWILGLVLGTRGVIGGYLNVQMQPAYQCGHSLVQWSGDDGPYHLLLTPTAHVQHGYNVWLPSLPNGTNSYNLSINQPEGLQFVLTMWGASGISYAGTTDILSVGPPATNRSCFFSDEEILGLYSFSFNITDTYDGYPPQCSNMTMSWPTSLESNVTGPLSRRIDDNDHFDDFDHFDDLGDFDEDSGWSRRQSVADYDTTSSSDNRGNTTYPPSMFGVIPLGNSFSIPITYDKKSKYAKYLPNSSRSDNPTTWTTRGTTYLNWTVPLAKGTRFILVAGIGSDQQWASGGSSSLFTVGQGSTGCSWNADQDTTPSVTATTGTYTGGSRTDPPEQTQNNNPVVKTILASVLSVLGTLLVIGLFLLCRRTRKKRREAAKVAFTPYAGLGSRKIDRRSSDAFDMTPQDTPLDLIASRDGSRAVAPILRSSADYLESPVEASPSSPSDTRHLMMNPYDNRQGRYQASSLPSSPIRDARQGSLNDFGRQTSMDPLLMSSESGTMINSPISPTAQTSSGTVSTHRPLMLHDRSMGLPYEEEEDVTELKRETLAMPETSGGGLGAGHRGPSGQRRRRQSMEYVVHRDAGRVRHEQNNGARVMELPPRYEELNWEEGDDSQTATHPHPTERQDGTR